ncbi:MAG: hypothetical protein R3D78_09180, partial [Paracoccaceae bacterium]
PTGMIYLGVAACVGFWLTWRREPHLVAADDDPSPFEMAVYTLLGLFWPLMLMGWVFDRPVAAPAAQALRRKRKPRPRRKR